MSQAPCRKLPADGSVGSEVTLKSAYVGIDPLHPSGCMPLRTEVSFVPAPLPAISGMRKLEPLGS